MPEDAAIAEEAEVAADLVRRIAAGEAAAEAEMVERYSRGLTFMLRRMTGRPDLADDLHQETFRVVLERLRDRGLEDPGRLSGFLHRTARNLFLGDYRKQARRRMEALEESQPPPDPSPGQLDRAVLDEEAALVRRLLTELEPERDRRILYRFYIAEDPKEHICVDLGLSSLHFNRVLFRARKRFEQLLAGFEKRRRLAGAGA